MQPTKLSFHSIPHSGSHSQQSEHVLFWVTNRPSIRPYILEIYLNMSILFPDFRLWSEVQNMYWRISHSWHTFYILYIILALLSGKWVHGYYDSLQHVTIASSYESYVPHFTDFDLHLWVALSHVFGEILAQPLSLARCRTTAKWQSRPGNVSCSSKFSKICAYNLPVTLDPGHHHPKPTLIPRYSHGCAAIKSILRVLTLHRTTHDSMLNSCRTNHAIVKGSGETNR